MQISDLTVSDKIKTIIEDKIQTESSENEDFHSINFFYLFLARTYVLLNSDDSAFLDEFAFVWDETFPRWLVNNKRIKHFPTITREQYLNPKISIKCPRCMKDIIVEHNDGKPVRGQECRHCGFKF